MWLAIDKFEKGQSALSYAKIFFYVYHLTSQRFGEGSKVSPLGFECWKANFVVSLIFPKFTRMYKSNRHSSATCLHPSFHLSLRTVVFRRKTMGISQKSDLGKMNSELLYYREKFSFWHKLLYCTNINNVVFFSYGPIYAFKWVYTTFWLWTCASLRQCS